MHRADGEYRVYFVAREREGHDLTFAAQRGACSM